MASSCFFFNDTPTTEIYTLSLHDALPIGRGPRQHLAGHHFRGQRSERRPLVAEPLDRKSTRLNSSHANISYAVFCLKKKNCRYQRFLRRRYHSHLNASSCNPPLLTHVPPR